jgi:hypothetical protein
MKRRRFTFGPKVSERERILAFNQRMENAAAAVGVEPKFLQEVPPERKRREPSASPAKPAAPLEQEVVRAIGALLASHPKVLFAVRQNAGAASYEAKPGKWAPVFFYKIVTGQRVRISDYWGILKDGRMLALEVKREGWKKPRDTREFEQAAFLMMVRNVGGIGAFVTSADEALALLGAEAMS